jgi:hypothetical protein
VEREEGEQSGGAMERDKAGGRARGTVEMLAAVENAMAARDAVIFSREWRQQATVRDS